MLIVVLGIVLLISLLLVRPTINSTNIIVNDIGLPGNAINELKKLLNP